MGLRRDTAKATETNMVATPDPTGMSKAVMAVAKEDNRNRIMVNKIMAKIEVAVLNPIMVPTGMTKAKVDMAKHPTVAAETIMTTKVVDAAQVAVPTDVQPLEAIQDHLTATTVHQTDVVVLEAETTTQVTETIIN